MQEVIGSCNLIIIYCRINIEWKKLDIEQSDDCSADFVMVLEQDGSFLTNDGSLNKVLTNDSNTTPQFGKFEKLCGSIAPEKLSRQVIILFKIEHSRKI